MPPPRQTAVRFPLRQLRALCLAFSAFLLLSSLSAQTRPLTCAIIQEPFEYTLTDLHGPRPAFDLELCHAVAAALKRQVIPLEVPDEASAVEALRAGRADLIPTLSADLTHLTDPTLFVAPPILLDAIGLLVPASTSSVASLAGRKICFFAETESATALRTSFRLRHLDFIPYPFSEEGEMQAALTSGNCPAIAGAFTRLAVIRASLHRAADYKLFPDSLAPDPLSSATRRTDPTLARTVLAVEQLLLNAASLDVTQANLPTALKSEDPAIQRLLGRTHELGPAAALDDQWPIRVLQSTGNYTEIALRTLPLTLPTPPATPLK